MADIEEFLRQRIDVAIKETEDAIKGTDPAPELLKMFNIHDTCKAVLEDLIKVKAPSTEDWVREKLYYLNNVMAEWRMLLTHRHSTPGIIRRAMNLHQSLKQIKKEPQDGSKKAGSVKDGEKSRTEKDLDTFGWSSDLDTFGWSSPSVDPQKIHGFDDKIMIMERLLVRQKTKTGFRAIGIVGIAGVGKTALCKVVFSNQEVKKHFLPMIWVCLSKQPKDDTDYRIEMVKRILTCLRLEDEIIDKLNKKGGLRMLLFALRRQLQGKRYLIVLDDVWMLDEEVQKFCCLSTQDENNPEQLAYGLPKEHGATVIATSRSREIAENMVGEKNLHTLLPLADNTSLWKIFRDAVERDKIVPLEDKVAGKTKEENRWKIFRTAVEKDGVAQKWEREMLKDRILENCAELPLVAKMKGQILIEKIVKERENNRKPTQQEAHQRKA